MITPAQHEAQLLDDRKPLRPRVLARLSNSRRWLSLLTILASRLTHRRAPSQGVLFPSMASALNSLSILLSKTILSSSASILLSPIHKFSTLRPSPTSSAKSTTNISRELLSSSRSLPLPLASQSPPFARTETLHSTWTGPRDICPRLSRLLSASSGQSGRLPAATGLVLNMMSRSLSSMRGCSPAERQPRWNCCGKAHLESRSTYHSDPVRIYPLDCLGGTLITGSGIDTHWNRRTFSCTEPFPLQPF